MKKLFAILLAVAMLAALAACGQTAPAATEETAAPAEEAAEAEESTEETDYTETVVTFDVAEFDGIPAHTVVGTLTAPKAEGMYPAVVMLHGTGSNRDEAGNGYAVAAPLMAKDGIVTLRIDFMGNGDSTADYRDYNYTSASLDAMAAHDYLCSLGNVDMQKIAVMGWSQGGTNALLAAVAYPEAFHAVITWSGSTKLDDMFEDFEAAKATAESEGGYEMTFDWRDSLMVGARWFQEVADTDVLAECAKIEVPVLAINGLDDTTVDPSEATAIAEACQNGTTQFLEGVDHTYNVFSGDYSAIEETVRIGDEFLLNVFAD